MSKYDNEEAYATFIQARKWAKRHQGMACQSVPEDWTALGDEMYPTSEEAMFACLICDAEFVWRDAPDHVIPFDDDDESYTEEGELKVPWWGWPIVIAVVPVAIPIALTVMAGEKVYHWYQRRAIQKHVRKNG